MTEQGWHNLHTSHARLEERVRNLERWQSDQNGEIEQLRQEVTALGNKMHERHEQLRAELRERFDRLYFLLAAALLSALANLVMMLFEVKVR